MYTKEEVYQATLDYFNGDDLATNVWIDKYCLQNEKGEYLEKTPDDMHRRMAKEIARIEKNKFKKPLTEDEIYELFKEFKRIVPAGSIMFGLGNPYTIVSLSNCVSLPPVIDSFGGISRTDEHIAQLSKRRAGLGFDISNLRPKGTPTKNSSKTSSGIVPFMEKFSETIKHVGQGGRRGASLQMISVHHPQILDFIRAKQDLTKITGSNISVRITDEFMNAVMEEGTYEQRWPVDSKEPVISQRVYAKVVWDELIENARNTAEPGVLFWDRIIDKSPADCYEEMRTVGANACSELPMNSYGICLLTSINLFSYVISPFSKNSTFDYRKLYKDAKLAARILDDIIDIELENINCIIGKVMADPEPEEIKQAEIDLWKKIKDSLIKGRRIGLGATGIGDVIAALDYRYGDEDSQQEVHKIYANLKDGAYEGSMELAKELGTFPIWDPNKERNNSFLKYVSVYGLKTHGRRNIACLTSAPTGSLSIMTQTTSGIEPCYKLEYTRRRKLTDTDTAIASYVDASGDRWEEYKVIHPKAKLWMEITGKSDLSESPWYGYCAEDLNWKSRINIQSMAQFHIDHNISSTINLPENVTEEEVSNIYLEAWTSGLKGITIYRKGSRSGVLIDAPTIQKTVAPKRPKELPCEVMHPTVLGQPYTVLIGIYNGDPYEIFAIPGHETPRDIRIGKIIKEGSGIYKAELDRGYIIDDIMKGSTPTQEAITRLVSTALRHGSDVMFVVDQLNKAKGAITSYEKALARCLKKLIKDGTTVEGEKCEKCSGQMHFQDGCAICSQCGWTKCS